MQGSAICRIADFYIRWNGYGRKRKTEGGLNMEIAVFVAGVFTGIIVTIVFALCAAGGDDD